MPPIDPTGADAIDALIERGELETAERICRERIAAGAQEARLYSQLAGLCGRSGRWQELRQWVARALALDPDDAKAHSHLGVAQRQAGDLEAAGASFRRALAIRADDARARNNLGTVLQEQGALADALACYSQAIADRPGFAEAHTNRGMLRLLLGQYPQGWPDYEWRHRVPRAGGGLLAHPAGRRWDGSTALAAGEPLLLVAEQGLGDTLQFARYVLPLRERGLAVRLCAQPPLHGLLRSSGLEPAPLSPAQAEAWTGPWLPLLSLPGVLGVSAENPIVNAPYLGVEPERIARWRALLASSPGPRIALAWQGNPAAEQTTLRGRSLPLEAFAAFARSSGARFVSLQKGFGAEQLAVCSFRDRFVAAQERIEQSWDFLDTAAILLCCDLVLSSDTALAHLAGGLGCPTWLLLPHQPEWRWGLRGDSSFWYPCLRLWRQVAPGDWDGLLGRVSEEFLALRQLQSLLAGGEAVPDAPDAPREPAEPEPEPRSAVAARLGAEGRWGELEAFARQRLLEDPQDPEAHNHLGIARQQLDDAADAVLHLQRALALRPDHAPYLLNLGNARQRLGDLPAAIACYRRALQQRPDAPELQRLLGQALLRADEPESALPHLEQALRLHPQEVEISNSLGQARFALGDAQGAVADFRRALALRPEDPAILCNLGTALQQLGDHAAAEPCFALALQHQPGFAEAHNNLGVGLQLQGRLQESIEQFGRALRLRPDYADAYSNLGNTLMEAGAHAAALDSFRSALALRSDHGDAHHNLGMALLLLGDYRRGWAEYEWRGRCSVPVVPHAIPPTRVWDGSPLAPGETLLLVCEQGLGDTLQFMRYALCLRQRSIPVRLCAQTNLHGILRSSAIDPDPLSPEQAASYSHGPWIPLLSLPGLLGVSPDNPLHTAPYIHVPPERVALWRSRLAHAPRPLLALHWQGNPAHETSAGRGRSLPLESFAVLAQRTPASFLSLQKGHGAEQLHSCSFRHRFLPAQELIEPTWDFLDIAAILLCCDLVLTSDSALAHLAGGLGCPTWLLLKHQPEWRWGLHGESSPWYPSLRLCRQTTPGDWNQLLDSLCDDLLALGQLQGLLGGDPEPAEDPAGLAFALGNARQEQGDPAGAIEAWRHALALRPDFPEALNNLGLTLHEQGERDAAIAAFREALERRPAFAEARFNLGNALLEATPPAGDDGLEEAIACYRQALALRPDLAPAQLNLGSALQERGELAAARSCFEAAIRLQPDDADAHGNLALLDLLTGDYGRGWAGSEWRFRGGRDLGLLVAQPAGERWPGGPLQAGSGLLLVAEQGLGDTIQFMRYVPLLRERGLRVHFCAPIALHGLIRATGIDPEPLTPEQGQAMADVPWLPLLSLPGVLGVSPRQLLVPAPYLTIPEALVQPWRERLGAEGRPVLALHWQGNPEHERRHARGRSLPLESFAVLAERSEARFVSLQKGFGAEQLAVCSFRDRFVAAQSAIDDCWDFLEIAAILLACDRLISADSAVVHLAGALGHPTSLLLKTIPDWRWGLEGETSFWYPPSLRLLRQRRRGDWAERLERLAAELESGG